MTRPACSRSLRPSHRACTTRRGRATASFEPTKKAWMAGVPLLAAVSAPSTLAADVGKVNVWPRRGPKRT